MTKLKKVPHSILTSFADVFLKKLKSQVTSSTAFAFFLFHFPSTVCHSKVLSNLLLLQLNTDSAEIEG